MSRVLLFDCAPRDPATGAVVPVRLCWKAVGAANYLGKQWEPVVDTPPSFESSIGFDGREFGAQPSAQVGQLVFGLSDRTRAAAALVWKNAAVTIRSAPWPVGGGNPADAAFSVIWTGQADDIAAASGFARLTLFDGGQALRVPLAKLKFGSSGDALLDSADAVKDRAADTIVPLAFGVCRNMPGLLVDRLNGIWLFAASPATAVAGFYDGGAAFTLGTARASLPALQASTPAAGTVDYCLNSAGKLLARPWTDPTYVFTCDATFGATKAADIASAIVNPRTAMAFKAGAIAAFNAAQPAANGLYVNDASTVAELLDRLFRGLGSWWKVRADGTIDMRQLAFAAPARTIIASRMGAPQRAKVVVPTAKRTIGYNTNNRVQSESEIAGIVLADWENIGGAGKPDDNATIGDNLIINSSLATDTAGWTLSNNTTRVVGVATDPAPAFFSFPIMGIGVGTFAETSKLALTGSARVYVSGFVWRTSAATGSLYANAFWSGVDGVVITALTNYFGILPPTSGAWVPFSFSFLRPAAASQVSIRFSGENLSAVCKIAAVRVSLTQRTADVTAANNAGGLVPGGQLMQDSGTGLQAAAQAFSLLVSDGVAVSFALDRAPLVAFDTTSLPVLASGESYALSAESLTGTGFTPRLKKRTTGGTPATLTSAAGTTIVAGSDYSANKGDARDARDKIYSFRVQGQFDRLYNYTPFGGGGGGGGGGGAYVQEP